MLSQQTSFWPNPYAKAMHSIGEKMRDVEKKKGGGRGEIERDRRRREEEREENELSREGKILCE